MVSCSFKPAYRVYDYGEVSEYYFKLALQRLFLRERFVSSQRLRHSFAREHNLVKRKGAKLADRCCPFLDVSLRHVCYCLDSPRIYSSSYEALASSCRPVFIACRKPAGSSSASRQIRNVPGWRQAKLVKAA